MIPWQALASKEEGCVRIIKALQAPIPPLKQADECKNPLKLFKRQDQDFSHFGKSLRIQFCVLSIPSVDENTLLTDKVRLENH